MAYAYVTDPSAILRGGAALLPDLAAQIAQSRQLDIQQQQAGTASLGLQRQLLDDQREQATANAYAADVVAISRLPLMQQPQALAALMAKYPKQSEALKRAYDTQDEAIKGADFRAAAEVYSFVQNGAPEKAAALIRKRIDADKAAGLDTSDDEDIALALESGDPAKVQEAAAQIGWQLSTAAGPEKFAATYGAVNPTTSLTTNYQWLKSQGRDQDAEDLLENEVNPIYPITTPTGVTAATAKELRGGGGRPQPQAPASATGVRGEPVSDAGSIAKGLFPGIEITQQRRDPNSALGKANPKSWHNRTGAAIDVVPIKGMTFAQYVKRFADAGYTILEAKNEVGPGRSKWATGDHWHVVLGGGPSGPAKVTSKAQFDKLPSGTVFVDPKGVTRRKP